MDWLLVCCIVHAFDLIWKNFLPKITRITL